MRIVGVDIGGTSIKMGLFDETGHVIERKDFATDVGDSVMENIIDQISMFDDFDAIGISAAGQIDPINGVLMGSVNIPGLAGVRIKDMLEKKLEVPVRIENDVNAAALGEKKFGVGQQHPDFLFLTYGTGIGGAIVLNSELYYGQHAFAGEFGHTITHAFGRQCNCGLQGCYERYASTTALIQEALKVNPSFENGKVLFEYWHEGDPDAKQVITNWVEEIAIGLINLVHSFNPSTIIVGGGIMEQEVLIDMIKARVDAQMLPSFKEVEIIKASLGNQSGMLGGVSLHL